MRRRPSRFLLGAALLSAIVLAGACGGSAQPIPVDIAQGLVAEIDAVEQGVRAGECRRTRSTLRRMDREVKSLPPDTDEQVRTTLGAGIAHLARLARGECKQKRPPAKKRKPKPAPVETTPEPEADPEPEPEIEAEPEPEPQVEEPVEEQPADEEEPTQEEQPREERPEEEEPDDGGGGDGETPNPCADNPGPTC